MNYGISILFRAIPLAMAAFCFAYGAYVFAAGDDPSRLTAGPVLFFLGSICIALYCTAATIIRQIIGTYTAAAKYLFPAIGYAVAAMTLPCGRCWPNASATSSRWTTSRRAKTCSAISRHASHAACPWG